MRRVGPSPAGRGGRRVTRFRRPPKPAPARGGLRAVGGGRVPGRRGRCVYARVGVRTPVGARGGRWGGGGSLRGLALFVSVPEGPDGYGGRMAGASREGARRRGPRLRGVGLRADSEASGRARYRA